MKCAAGGGSAGSNDVRLMSDSHRTGESLLFILRFNPKIDHHHDDVKNLSENSNTIDRRQRYPGSSPAPSVIRATASWRPFR